MLRTSAGKSKNPNGALVFTEVEEWSSVGGILGIVRSYKEQPRRQ